MNPPGELFLSHAAPDRQIATGLAQMLRHHGIPVWYSRTDIRGARQWHDEIGDALKRCDWFAIILTPNSVTSRWTKREVVHALNEARYDDRVIPLLYAPCDVDRLSWVLPQLQIVDFQESPDDGYRELLQIWGMEYSPA